MLTNKYEIRFFGVLGVTLFVFLIVTYIVGHRELERERTEVAARPTVFDSVSVTAKAAYVYDATTNKALFDKNGNERLALASLTKVMTALVASDMAPPYSTVTITRDAVATAGDSGLLTGERWLLKDLLDFSLVNSSNDGMRAVALSLGALHSSTSTVKEIENDFVQKMNAKANEIGMKDTYYFNETGLDESLSKGGAYGTARDMALLFDFILKHKPDLLSATRATQSVFYSLDKIAHIARNTDTIVGEIPGLTASKTGFTDLAGGNLVIALDPELGHPIIISVLGSSEEGRFADMLSLIQASFQTLQSSVVLRK